MQAEFGVGKSHLLAATAVMAVGGVAAWEKVKQREDAEGISAAEVDEAGKLTSAHLTTFKDNYRQLKDLRTSFEATRSNLLRSARLARAQLPEGHKGIKDVARAQSDVLSELEKVNDLVVNPDTVHTRLQPRLDKLEQAYVPAYLDELIALDSVQTELEALAAKLRGCDEARVLEALSVVAEADNSAHKCWRQRMQCP